MEVIAVVVMLVALLALAGVVAFFLYDYFKHKDDNTKSFSDASSRLEAEKTDRLSNIKFVVDQVNEVNTDIYKTMTSNVDTLKSDTLAISNSQSNLIQGIDKFLKFSSNYSLSQDPTAALPSTNVSILDLPGTTTPNVQLIQHVTALMGVTATDLNPTNPVLLCNKDNTKCIRIPDNEGNLYLTPLTNDTSGNVIVDSTMHVKGDLKLFNNAQEKGAVLATPDGLVVQSSKVGVGAPGFGAPKASLHVQGSASQPIITVTPAPPTTGTASDAILVTADGELVTSKPISLRSSVGDASTNVATISIAQNGATNVLKIASPKMELNGDVEITGAATVKGKAVTTAA